MAGEADTLQTVTTRSDTTSTSILSTGPHISGVTGLFSDKVGINANPTDYTLTVGGEIYASSNLFGAALLCGTIRDQAGGNVVIQDDGGNVGIGTNNPAYPLHVVGSTRPALFESDNSVNIIKLGNSACGVATYNGMDLIVNSTANSQVNAYGMPLTFGTSTGNGVNVTERVRIDTDGKVGIGTDSPIYALDVYGTGVRLGAAGNSWVFENAWEGLIKFAGSDFLGVQAGAAGTVYLKGGRTLGLGMSKLDLSSMLSMVANNDGGNSADLYCYGQLQWDMHSYYNEKFIINYNSGTGPSPLYTPAFVVAGRSESGYIGIGTSTPAYRLDVGGDVGGTGAGDRITLNGTPYLLSGDSPAETQTLQQVCDNDNSTTTSILSTGPHISGVTGLFSDALCIGTDAPNAGIGLQVNNGAFYVYNGNAKLDEIDAGYFAASRDLVLKAGTAAAVQLQAGSTKILTAKYDGTVGIGTDSPTELLHVSGGILLAEKNDAAETWHNIIVADNSASGVGTHAGIGFNAQGWTNDIAKAGIFQKREGSYGRGSLFFVNNNDSSWTSATESDAAITIDSDARVGIGSTNPQALLDVVDTVASDNKCIALFEGQGVAASRDDGGQYISIVRSSPISYADGAIGGIFFGLGSNPTSAGAMVRGNYKYTAGRDLEFLTSTGNSSSPEQHMVIKGDGKVGIGTDDPAVALEVHGEITADGGGSINGTPTNAINALDSLGVGLWSAAGVQQFQMGAGGGFSYLDMRVAGDMIFRMNGNSEAMRILEDGKVGIGTTAPTEDFEVFQAGKFKVDATDSPIVYITNNSATSSTNGTATLKFQQGNTQDGGSIIGGRDGNYSDGASRDSYMAFLTATNATDSEKMRITTAGNVGIGTSAPSGLLHVDGEVTLPSSLYFRNNAASIQVGSSWNTSVLSFLNGATAYLEFDVPNSRIKNNLGKYLTASSNAAQFGTLDGYDTTFVVSGVEKMRINTDGKVGIGTASASYAFEVHATNAAMSINNGTTSRIVLSNDSTTNTLYSQGSSSANKDFGIRIGTTERMRIAADGSVGIGTTAPLATLDVRGTISGSGDFLGTGVGNRITNNGTPYLLSGDAASALTLQDVCDNGSTTTTSITSSGPHISGATGFFGDNVCIGLTEPRDDAPLTIKSSTVNHKIFLENDNITRWGIGVGNASYYQGNFMISRAWVGGEDLMINSVGNVGIGTNPSYRLDVYSATTDHVAQFKSSDADAFISIQDNYDTVYLGHDSGDNVMSLGFSSTMGSTSNLSIDTAGNIGIGTANPLYKLEAKSAVDGDWVSRIYNTHANGYGLLARSDSTNNNPAFGVYGNGAYRLTVLSSGNVGIGSNAPAYELDVNGTIHGTSGNFETAITINGNPVLTGATDANTYVTSASFNTSNGVLTLTRNDAATVTADLDGKYQDEITSSTRLSATLIGANGDVSNTEYGYLDGVTSAIQTQLNAKQATLTFGIADTNAVKIDSASVADNDYAKFTANGLEGRSFSEVKTDLSLSNVENTALSTWAGSSNITTVGTISAGTWQGTAIADGYISSASTWNAKQAALTFGIADTNAVKIDSASVADNEFARFTANGLESRSASEVRSDLSLGSLATLSSIDADSITVGNLEVDNFKASAIVTEAEGIGSNDNDTSLPTSAAVKDYVDNTVIPDTNTYVTGASFNTGDGVLTLSRNDSSTVTTDLDGKYQDEITSSTRLNANLIGANGDVSNTEYGYLNGVTSAIQTQLNGKQATLTFGIGAYNVLRSNGIMADNEFLKVDGTQIEGRSSAELKSDLSLNNVENTALSTWAGSSNITTVGTISAGTWQGTAIASGYIADAATWNSKQDEITSSDRLSATLIGSNGNVSNTEYGYLNGVTSAIQTQVDAKQATLTFGIADTNAVKIDSASVADNDYAKFTANGLEGRSFSEVKTDLSLSNVENTALSTWAGSSNITTVGTISAGTWQGTAIADGYISSASTWNAKQAALTFGIANTNAVKIDSASVADNEFARFTANGLESRSASEVRSDLSLGSLATLSAVDADSVTVSNIEVDNFKGSAIVTEAEGIGSNDNDTSLPTSAAVKDYVDNTVIPDTNTYVTGASFNTSNGILTLSRNDSSTVTTDLDGKYQEEITSSNRLSAALIGDNGNVSNTEYGYLNGVTSAIQTQLGGKQATLTFGISDDNTVQIDSASVADNDYAKFTANGLEGRSFTEIKSDLSLSNVENTALSTWGGSSNITTVGTISAGTWQGTAITDGYISSASTWNGKQDALTFGIANTNAVKIDSASVADNEYTRFTANGLESRSVSEVRSDLSLGSLALLSAVDADSVTLSNVEVDNFKASAIVTEAEGIGSNDNDTSLPTSAAVKDYVDNTIIPDTNTFVTGVSFNTSDGVLTLTRNDSATVTADLDGKYQNEITSSTRLSATLIGANGNVSNTEYGYLNGVTSAIQTQLNAKQATLTFGISDDNAVQIDSASVADNDYAKFTSNGLEGRSFTEIKSDLSLNNVENTALSTWAGSSNITTVGTISAGTWQGTAIADGYISSASTWNAKQAALTFGIANTNAVKIDSASVADNEFARFTANGLESRSASEVRSDLSLGSLATLSAVDADSVTLSNVEVDNFKASAIVTEAEGIGSNDNDTSLPTSAAVKDYVDNTVIPDTNTYVTAASFNTSDGVLTLTRNDAGTVTADLDGKYQDEITSSSRLSATLIGANGNVSNTEYGYLNGVTSAIQTQLDAKQATLTFGIADTNTVKIDSASVADNDYAKFTANGLEGRSFSEVKTDLSLSNVENTALSTWAGSSNITTVGTISAGTWQGTAIADGYISSASAWNAKQAALTFGIANTNAVKIDSASVADNDYAKFTANGLEGRSFAEAKTDLSLNNVENTALSTWAGTSNITTVGTISAGTWQGTAIADGYISSASTWNAKQDALTFGIADTNAVKIDGASVADDEYARFTANGLESRSTSEVAGDLGLSSTDSPTFANVTIGQKLIHDGDTNTYLDFATDTISLFTAGSERVTVNSAGNVGIGTATPNAAYELHVQGASYTTGSVIGGGYVSAAPPTNGLVVQGDVGIGLYYAGSSQLSVYENASIGAGYYGSAAPSNGLLVQGNVGIGTTNPSTELHVDGTITCDDGITTITPLTSDTTTAYTLVIGDQGNMVSLSNASAVTLTIPANSAVAFPIGTEISAFQAGAGQVTIAGAGGVTVNAADAELKTRVQYSSATLYKTASDTWLVVGDLTA